MGTPMAAIASIDRREAIVEKLEGALAMAKAGELVALGMAAVYPDGAIGTSYVETPKGNLWLLLGAASRLVYRINDETLGGDEK